MLTVSLDEEAEAQAIINNSYQGVSDELVPPLSNALAGGDVEIAKLLLKFDADVTIRNDNVGFRSSLEASISSGSKNAIDLLIPFLDNDACAGILDGAIELALIDFKPRSRWKGRPWFSVLKLCCRLQGTVALRFLLSCTCREFDSGKSLLTSEATIKGLTVQIHSSLTPKCCLRHSLTSKCSG